MNKGDRKVLFYGLGSLLVGAVIKAAARKIWHTAKDSPAPDNPADPEVKTAHAMIWTVSLALLTGFGKLLYRSVFSEDILEAKERASMISENNK